MPAKIVRPFLRLATPVSGLSIRTLFRRPRRLLLPLGVLGAGALPLAAADWNVTNGAWSGSSNWTNGGVPNGAGAVVNRTSNATGSIGQDIAAGATVGTISLNNSSSSFWTFNISNNLILDQDGAGSGAATIVNNNTGGTLTNSIVFSSLGGSLVLADDLLLINSGTSLQGNGALRLNTPITGTGNITVRNVQSASSVAGAISLGGANTFTGNVLVEKGTLSLGNVAALGNAANVLTLGASGTDQAVVLVGQATFTHNIAVAGGTGGTNTLVGSGSAQTLSSTVTLNGNLTYNKPGDTVTLSGAITGAGALTKTGAGALSLMGANTYAGGTTLAAGTLDVLAGSSLGTGPVTLAGGTLAFRFIADTTYTHHAGFGGTGTVTLGSKTLTLLGSVAPGTAGAGTLTVSGGTLAFGTDTQLAFTLGATNLTPLSLTSGASLALGAGALDFSDFNFTTGSGFGMGQYTLISVADGGLTTGTLGSSLTGLIGSAYQGTLALSGNNLTLNVALAAIPEPSTWAALAGTGALGLAVWRRKKKKVETAES